MPFKSQAQRRKFAQLLVEGKISPDTFEEWTRETGGARLPERVNKSGAAKRKAAKTTPTPQRRAAKRPGVKTKRPGAKAKRPVAKKRSAAGARSAARKR